MSEIVYLVEFKPPDFPWTHWQACVTLEDAEKALTARRKELTDPAGQRVIFRIVKHEVIDSDVAGPLDIEKCSTGHNFAKLPSHPKENGISYCPHCLLTRVNYLTEELYSQDARASKLEHSLKDREDKLGKLSSIIMKFLNTADKEASKEAFVEYEQYSNGSNQ